MYRPAADMAGVAGGRQLSTETKKNAGLQPFTVLKGLGSVYIPYNPTNPTNPTNPINNLRETSQLKKILIFKKLDIYR